MPSSTASRTVSSGVWCTNPAAWESRDLSLPKTRSAFADDECGRKRYSDCVSAKPQRPRDARRARQREAPVRATSALFPVETSECEKPSSRLCAVVAIVESG